MWDVTVTTFTGEPFGLDTVIRAPCAHIARHGPEVLGVLGAVLGFQRLLIMSFGVLFDHAVLPINAVSLFEALGLQFLAVLVDPGFFGTHVLQFYAVIVFFAVLFAYVVFPVNAVSLFEALGLQSLAVLVDFGFFGTLVLQLYAVLVFFDVLVLQCCFFGCFFFGLFAGRSHV